MTGDRLHLVYVPVPDRETGLRLGRDAVRLRQAACANLHGPMTSIYEWEGDLCEESEFLLLFKTAADRVEALESWLVQAHPYECPCVISGDVERVNPAFGDWVRAMTRLPSGA